MSKLFTHLFNPFSVRIWKINPSTMILIADSGSTKTSWSILKDNEHTIDFSSEGYNPYYVGVEYIKSSLSAKIPDGIDTDLVREIYFYGAGCSGEQDYIIEDALSSIFRNAQISVQSDLLAAAKSVLGNEEGFVAILGTGTNSGIYKDGQIVEQIDSLGFVLGDEGSGAYLGKKLLSLYARNAMPKDLAKEFEKTYQLIPKQIVPTFYTAKLQNRYSASFTLFVNEHIQHPFIIELVGRSFRDFFENIVSLYPTYKSYRLNTVGSIGYSFASVLTVIAEQFGMEVGKITKSPMQGLVDFHAQNNS